MQFHTEWNEEHRDWQCRCGIAFGAGQTPEEATLACLEDVAYGEEAYIRDRAAPGETFRAFVLRIRGGNNTVTITTGDDFTKIFEV